jgi:hypothetical protein
MARTGVTREQVFEAAEALVREGQSPTVVAVRTRLGGGSPNTITPLLAEWKGLHETRRAEILPPAPEPVEAVMRQVWGAAWREAQGQLEGEREALSAARKEMEKERAEMLAEIGRLDGELEAAKETARARDEALEAERRAHEQASAQAREAQALAAERGQRIAALERELSGEREAHAATGKALTALRIEAATLTERAAHAEELRTLLRTLQDRQGRAGETEAKPKRRTRSEG